MENISIKYLKGGDTIDKFNSKHFAFIVLGVSVVSMKTYPSLITFNGGRDSWLILIIASVIIFFYAWFMFSSFKKTNCFDLYKIYCGAVGKFFGNLLIILFAISLFLTLLECASVEANSMHTNMLLEVPTWYILLFLFFQPYTRLKRKSSRNHYNHLNHGNDYFSGITISILTAKYKKFYFLMPILKDGFTEGHIKALLQILGLYGCFVISFPFFEDIKNKKKIVKISLLSLLFVIQMQIVNMIGLISTFDIYYLNTMVYPNILQTQLVEVSRFMESGEFFVIIQIVSAWYIKYVLTFYALMKILKRLKIYDKYSIYTTTFLVLIGGLSLCQDLFNLFTFLGIYTYITLANFVIIPFFMMLIYRIRTSKKQELIKLLKLRHNTIHLKTTIFQLKSSSLSI